MDRGTVLKYKVLKSKIIDYLNDMEDGGEFPPRLELCKVFSTTSSTLAKAFAELEHEGIVKSIKGKGTYKIKNANKVLEAVKSDNWGIVTLDISSKQYSQVMKGISDVAIKYGVNLIFFNSNFDEKLQSEFIEKMLKSDIDGFIIVPVINSDWKVNQAMYKELINAKVPFVFCHRGCPGINAPLVKKNDFWGAYLQAKYLIDSGCKKIVYLSNIKYQISLERIQGFLSFASENEEGFDRDDVIIQTISDEELTEKLAIRLRAQPEIDGICCFCDKLARVAYDAIKIVNRKVGSDIKVIGYDDTELCECLDPKLTSVGFDNYEMGKTSAELLYNLLHAENLNEFDVFWQAPIIVKRKSCGEY